jgi:hypothetical protein
VDPFGDIDDPCPYDSDELDPDSSTEPDIDSIEEAPREASRLFVGAVGTFALVIMTESFAGVLLGLVGWLAFTVYVGRQRTVQAAVARTLQGLAVALLLFPFIVFSPAVDGGGVGGRFIGFIISFIVVGIPAALLVGASFVVRRLGTAEGA